MKKIQFVVLLYLIASFRLGMAQVPADSSKNEFDNYTETVAGINIDMVAIKGGAFIMGSPENETGREDEEKQHAITVSDFYIGKTEVTNRQYCEFLNEKGNQIEEGGEWINLNGSWDEEKCRIYKSGNSFNVQSGYDNYPVNNVSWYGANAYCVWLSQKTGKAYRLPTEAEWEYACRAGTSTPYNTGSSLSASQANYLGDSTTPVGRFAPNVWGLYDMHGNVCEWCNDWYGYDNYNSSPQTNPQGPSAGEYKVYRGGSWFDYDWHCRSAYRDETSPVDYGCSLGFRLVSSSTN